MLNRARNTLRRNANTLPDTLEPGVAAGARIYQGSLVVAVAGFAEPGSSAVGLIALGRAEETVDNSGGLDGEKRVKVSPGAFKFKNAAADAVTQADLYGTCYVVDDETVARTSGANTRSPAGTIIDLEADGVWVQVFPGQAL